MQNNNYVTFLESEIAQLRQENAHLKKLLSQANISYPSTPHTVSATDSSSAEPVQVSTNLANRFYSYFWGRMDVFSKRAQNKSTGKAGYYPQCDNFWDYKLCPKASGKKIKCSGCENRKWSKLTLAHIQSHLSGCKEDCSDVIGIYPLFPDGTCKMLVFDFDNHEKGAESNDFAHTGAQWMEEVDAVRKICSEHDVPFITERSRSGHGAHIWIFFKEAIPAALARQFGFALLEKGAETVNLRSFQYYDRMLPAQEALPPGSIGNLIALPLQGRALKAGNSAFIDENWNPYPDQWTVLFQTEKLSKEQVTAYLTKWQPEKLQDSEKPWERKRDFIRDDINGAMDINLADGIYINTLNIKPRLQNQLRRMAAFSNPTFFRNQAIGLSNFSESRIIYHGSDDNGYIRIPRGLLEDLLKHCEKGNIPYEIHDHRSNGHPIQVSFHGELRASQKPAVQEMLHYENGILSAATAFGKTVVCSKMIAERKTSTLILLESSALVEQWENSLNQFLQIDEVPPEYTTPAGRKKRRKSVIGKIQGSQDTSTGIIDIAMAGSLYKKGTSHPRLEEYGLVIVDECHHAASDTVRRVLNDIHARYVYGVTATPNRGDGLERINLMLLGPIRYRFTAKERAIEQGIAHLVIPRFTRTVDTRPEEKKHINDAYELLRHNDARNQQIVSDVIDCVKQGRTPVVLSRYTDLSSVLYALLQNEADHVFLLTGNQPKKEQRELRHQMEQIPSAESLILIATGQLIGEGFDFPRLDTLFMATPVAWKGVLEQFAGRLNRDYPGKQDVIIYDYVDHHIPAFHKMYAKRLKTYKTIGYQLFSALSTEKQITNAIFDMDTYAPIYHRDLTEAEHEIVISSPSLSRKKVQYLMNLLKPRQEEGIKVSIVTYHPDTYKYGGDTVRMNLLHQLQHAGFSIQYVHQNCEKFAVIDRRIVWYGSMNLLSKEDIDDNLMRVVDTSIAEELLELAYGTPST